MIDQNEAPRHQPALIASPTEMPPSSALCSPGLTKLFSQEDGRAAVRLISINPTLRRECEAICPVLQAAKIPATSSEIGTLLAAYAPHYGVTARSQGEWAMLFAVYLETLEGLPLAAIKDAFLRWNRGEGHQNLKMASFFPKAPQLYILADQANRDLIMAAYRAKKALEYTEPRAKPEVTAEERAAIKEQFRRLGAQLGAGRSIPDTPRPTGSQHAVAEKLRVQADAVGDVI